MKQLHYLFAALLLITASHCAAASKPNLIFILVDDLGYGDLSSYGATDLETPRIDRLMGESLRFNQFYANCTVCSPTRASLLTGRYPDNVGVPGVIRQNPANSWGYFDPTAVTLPDMLNKAGYDRTLSVHVGELEGTDHMAEMRKMRLLLESLL